MKESTKKYLLFPVKIALAVVILTWLIRRNNICWSDFSGVSKPCLLAAALCIFFQIVITGVRWFFLLRANGIRLPFRESFSLTMQGVFFSLFIPAGSVGGDLIKAGILVKRSKDGQKFNGAFSIAVDRICGLIALVLCTMVSILLVVPSMSSWSGELKTMTWTLFAVSAAVFCAAISLFFYDFLFRIKPCRILLTIANRYTKDGFSKAAEAIAVYRKSWSVLICWILLSCLLAFPLLAGGVFFLAKGLPENNPENTFRSAFLASNTSQTVGALPLTPGGIGTRDVTCKKYLEATGFSNTKATLIPLLYTGLLIAVSLSGSIFFVLDRAEKQTENKD